jgi:hypothetical protein
VTGPEAEAGHPGAYVTEIWCPPADNGVHSLFLPMREPEPLPEPELEAEP